MSSTPGAPAPKPRKKKRIHPPRKIVPRGRMGVQWIVGPIVVAVLIAIAGTIFLLAQAR